MIRWILKQGWPVALVAVAGALGWVTHRWHLPMPDLVLGYTPGDLRGWASALDRAGIARFVAVHLLLDGLWPVLYGRFLVGFGEAVARRCGGGMGFRRWVWGAVGADEMENLFLSGFFVLHSTGGATEILGWVASAATLLKWGLLAGGVLQLLGTCLRRS